MQHHALFSGLALYRPHVVDSFVELSVKGDCAILAVNIYKMQVENSYSYLIAVKLLTPLRSLKHFKDQFT